MTADLLLATTRTELRQLCGELLLRAPPTRPPSRPPAIARSSATIGLELLDLLLNPDHVQRVTEELNLRNTLTLERSVRVDISLDRLSRQQENGASQVSALGSGRLGLHEAARTRPRLLWLPIDTVPRPISVAVSAKGADGSPLPRPAQPAVRRALGAALGHILLASLQAHASEADREPAVHALLHDDSARWLLQSALQSVAEDGAATHRAYERVRALRERRTELGLAALSDSGEVTTLLDSMASAAGNARPDQTAARLVRDVLAGDGPFLELLRLVHHHYIVVVGVDPQVRNHTVLYDLPEADARAESSLRASLRRVGGGLDPRVHSYSAHITVPLPDNVSEYNLYVQAASKDRAPGEVSLIGVIHYGGHLVGSSLEALSTCADQLDATVADALAGTLLAASGHGTGRTSAPAGLVARKLAYIASQAAPALDRIDAVLEQQNRAAYELEARSDQGSPRLVRRLFGGWRNAATAAQDHTRAARDHLGSLLDDLRRHQRVDPALVDRTTTALRTAIGAMAHPLLAHRLTSSELTGREIGRIWLSRSGGTSPTGVRPRTLEVWATVADESRSYAPAALGPPLGLMLLVYLTGALLFDSATWPVHASHIAEALGGERQAGAIVGVLLLVPGFALTQVKLPDRLSVSGRLHQAGHLFVVVAIATLATTATVLATLVGGQASAHPHLVLWTLRVALGLFTGCSLWAAAAARLRKSYSWRPKGLGLVDTRRVEPGRPGHRLRSWVAEVWRYGSKPPDAEFDLTRPSEDPWRMDQP